MYKILVVEDEEMLRNNISELFESEDYIVDSAENGMTGMKKAKSGLPDLIVCDVMMPVMDGFTLLEELQKDEETADIPFIFLTAKVETKNLRRGMKLGADDYIFKPFDVDDLLDAVKTRLKKKELSGKKIKTMQEQIAHKISHDLRTPLVPILGYAQMIDEEQDIDVIKDMAKTIRTSSNILHNRLEKFLLYKDLLTCKDGLDIKNATPKTIINDEIVRDCISSLPMHLNPADRTKTEIEQGTLVINDWLLRTIINELAENGLKFSAEEKDVFIKGYHSDDHYIFQVTDHGSGMKKADIKSFSAFYKFGKDRFAEPGLGLGLPIVQKIVKMYSGYLSIDSELNKYTTSEVGIPIRTGD